VGLVDSAYTPRRPTSSESLAFPLLHYLFYTLSVNRFCDVEKDVKNNALFVQILLQNVPGEILQKIRDYPQGTRITQ
jgi:hypothetical protein